MGDTHDPQEDGPLHLHCEFRAFCQCDVPRTISAFPLQ